MHKHKAIHIVAIFYFYAVNTTKIVYNYVVIYRVLYTCILLSNNSSVNDVFDGNISCTRMTIYYISSDLKSDLKKLKCAELDEALAE